MVIYIYLWTISGQMFPFPIYSGQIDPNRVGTKFHYGDICPFRDLNSSWKNEHERAGSKIAFLVILIAHAPHRQRENRDTIDLLRASPRDQQLMPGSLFRHLTTRRATINFKLTGFQILKIFYSCDPSIFRKLTAIAMKVCTFKPLKSYKLTLILPTMTGSLFQNDKRVIPKAPYPKL